MQSTEPADDVGSLRPRASWMDSLAAGTAIYTVTTSLIILGAWYSLEVTPRAAYTPATIPRILECLVGWDGRWYASIVEQGYSYNSDRHSNVAFFPALPAIAWCLSRVTGAPAEIALLVTANVTAWGGFVLAHRYCQVRSCDRNVRAGAADFAVMTLALCPASIFLRSAYIEPVFLVILLAVLLGIEERWAPWKVAVLCGAASGVRIVGIALLPAVLVSASERFGLRKGFCVAAVLVPVGCFGAITYMLYLYFKFGDPFLFMTAQSAWALREDPPWPGRLWSLLSFEPIWSVYQPSSPAYWALDDSSPNILFDWKFWNPVFFVACLIAIVAGIFRGWLTRTEVLVSLGLWLIPYVFHSYRIQARGHARFALVVFPAFLVAGRLLAQCPEAVRNLVFAALAVTLCLTAMLLARGEPIF